MEPRTSLTRMLLLLAALAVVLGALHFASSIVTPVLLSMVLALIFWPVYLWLRGRGLGTLPALIVLLLLLIVGVVALGLIVAYSVSGLVNRMALYSDHFAAELQSLDASLASVGLGGADLTSTLSPDALAGGLGALISGAIGVLYQGLLMLLYLLFFLAEGPAIMDRIRVSLAEGDPNPARLARFGRDVGQYFILRAGVNAITGAGVALVLWLLGVDFPLLWGVLTFFLSFIPYVGMFLASVPSVLLAWAEYDLARALVVIVALTVVNATAENLVQPALMHKGLNLSPTFVLLSVFFWSWLLGGGGSFLAVPLSLGVLAILANFPETHWFVHAVTTKSEPPGPLT
jgi:predicted PurR-regulated permease PerM